MVAEVAVQAGAAASDWDWFVLNFQDKLGCEFKSGVSCFRGLVKPQQVSIACIRIHPAVASFEA